MQPADSENEKDPQILWSVSEINCPMEIEGRTDFGA